MKKSIETSYRVCIVISGIALQLIASSGCTTRGGVNQEAINAKKTMTPSNQITEAELTPLIKTYSEDVGSNGETACRKLQSYPREALIQSLLAMRNKLGADDPKQYWIAFVLCNLGYEYQDNVQRLTSPLRNRSSAAYENADSAATMLGRLVSKGDKALLRILFESAPTADASLAEALSDVFAGEVQTNPKEFLIELEKQPKQTRLRVYELIKSGPLAAADLKKLKANLIDLSKTAAPIANIAKEMLSSSIFQ